MAAADLDVYVESLGNFGSSREYSIQSLLPHVEEAGLKVRVLDRPAGGSRAPAALLHVDLTEVPQEYSQIGNLYQRSINGRALSIHRHLYSTLRLDYGDSHPGPVVVKTVLNSRGRPELRWRQYRNGWTRAAHALRKIATPDYKERLCPRYRVYGTIAEVPAEVWRDERLMVEKFAFDSLDLPIVKHRYMFLLGAELNMRQVYEDVLCAGAKIVSNEVGGAVPDEVRAVREKLHLDYGAIDYFIADGKGIVVDANKTVGSNPSWLKRNLFRQEFDRRMAEALIGFIRG
ncbi:hypothetical protein [Mesorhizobium sp.]|uniref:hypothetical protein n=1 Tax=Mesorhizobium sp. TaxID=1871066 RepID=UPI000FD2401E|nr:hypothetical protein [Mesorhizobium sp.]RVC58821.1 hypothetical protein EN779_17925 [Mesorhizobium sp. M4B.F.Ca.ET.088.02.2.1]RWF29260.1 MAG: hypothetical protein EOS45_19100 [Mesorhizobium sp.]